MKPLINKRRTKEARPGRRLTVGGFGWFLLQSALCIQVLGQNYEINWSTLDGGGGTSTGGVYTVTGTIGQPDAGSTPMTGGSYAVVGGFWSFMAVQTPGAPWLTIRSAGPGQVMISWNPETGTNWVLQESPSLSPAAWVDSASGTANPIVVTIPGPRKFYRLFKP